MDLIDQARKYFFESFRKSDPKERLYEELPRHVPIVEKWAKRLLTRYPKANSNVLLISVWLHDIGQAFGKKEEDHAVKSERVALSFLPSIGADDSLTTAVAHCVRAHRCKDVLPETLEAKLLAAADSASHFTDIVYIDMVNKMAISEVQAKIERDWRDVSVFPDLQLEIQPLYESWSKLLNAYPEWVKES
jgi:HD superfamily phosphodiesterase